VTAIAAAPAFSASLRRIEGLVQVQAVGFGPWKPVRRVPVTLSQGEKLRTGPGASAVLFFADGTRLDLEGNASFVLEADTADRKILRLVLGTAILDARGAKTRLITPTAVAAVRQQGAAFRATVLAGGRTTVQLFEGLLGIEDNRGHQALLRPQESVRVDLRGMAVPRKIPTGTQMRKATAAERLRREMRVDARRDARAGSTAAELRTGELERGRALIDRDGKRVRVERFVIRPGPTQFKLVSLTGRGAAIDYFYYLGTFNAALPGNLNEVWGGMLGAADAAPGRYLSAYETGMSNGTDSVLVRADGGHLVDLNANADATDDVTTLFDAASDSYLDVTGRSVFRPLFDRFGVYLNGRLKRGYTGTNLQALSDASASTGTDPFSGAALSAANAYVDGTGFLASRTENTTFPDGGSMRRSVYESFSDGAFIQTDDYSLDGDDGVASTDDFGGTTSGDGYRRRLFDFNLERVVTATEFGGRKIDLLLAPRFMVLSGLIQ
jgi:hypothetical protein